MLLNRLRHFHRKLQNQQGFVLVMAIIFLAMLVTLSLSSSNSSNMEILMAKNESVHQITFYTAESARAYVEANRDLYGSDYVTIDDGPEFPLVTDPNINAKQRISLGSSEMAGSIVYKGSSKIPPGLGFEVGKFKAHNYEMTANGFYDEHKARSDVYAGFFRVGF